MFTRLLKNLRQQFGLPAVKSKSMVDYQQQVRYWVLTCFGIQIALNKQERQQRFLEEALELYQAGGMSAHDAHIMVDYVFSRPVGDIEQEIGGTMVCLSILCSSVNVDLHAAATKELNRCWLHIDKIRAKHASKPANTRSPLPGVISSK